MTPLADEITLQPSYTRANIALDIPGSKSIANRALLLAAFADGVSAIAGAPDSDDIQAALSSLDALGVRVDNPEPGTYRIHGGPTRRHADVDVRSSGTVGRFLPGLLAAQPKGEWTLTATEQLARRPLTPLVKALRNWGAGLEQPIPEQSFPLRVRGGGLTGGQAVISAARSSQFASGLLLASPLTLNGADLTVTEVDPDETYLDLTLDAMRAFSVEASSRKDGDKHRIRVAAGQRYRAAVFPVEADYNSALYFLSLPLLVGGKARVRNLAAGSGQPGRKFLAILERLGGVVTEDAAGVEVWASGQALRGGFTVDMRAMSEMALTLGVLAVFATAPVTMVNLAHIRGHETDRLAVLTELLGRFGVMVREGEDWIEVHPVPRAELGHAVVDSCGDHRVAMAFSLLGLGGGGVTIRGAGAVAKTFPDYFERLAQCGMM